MISKHFFFCVYLLPGSSFSQLDLINTSLTDPQKNILYLGIENAIQITGLDDDDNLRIKSSSSKIYRSALRSDYYHLVKPGNQSADTLRVYVNNVLVLNKVFEVHKLSDPVARLGSIRNSSATVREILRDPTLSVVLPDCFYDHSFRVFGFEVHVIQNNDTIAVARSYPTGSTDTLYVTHSSTGELEFETRTRTTFEYVTEARGSVLLDHHKDRIREMLPGNKLLIENYDRMILNPPCTTSSSTRQ